MPSNPLALRSDLYEWEYALRRSQERESRTIIDRFAAYLGLAFPSTYSLSMLRQVMAGKQERNAEGVRSFVFAFLSDAFAVFESSNLKALFEGLRYRVEVRKSPHLGSCRWSRLRLRSAPSVRPMICLLSATGLSGRTGFEEVLDDYEASHIADPLSDADSEGGQCRQSSGA